MSKNPYQPPVGPSADTPAPAASVEELVRLRGIAVADRRVLFCIVCQLGLVAAAMKLFPVDPRDLEVPYVLVVLFSLCFTVQLVMRLKGILAAFLLGLLSATARSA